MSPPSERHWLFWLLHPSIPKQSSKVRRLSLWLKPLGLQPAAACNRSRLNLLSPDYNMSIYILYTILSGLAILAFLLYVRNPYVLQDLAHAVNLLRIGFRLSKYVKRKPYYTVLDGFLDKVARHPDKRFIVFEKSSYTYREADLQSNRVARALSTHANLKEGDTVALFLGNEPHFVWIWLALAKLGCTAALLNYNIRSKALLHCFSCCDAKVVIAGAGKMAK